MTEKADYTKDAGPAGPTGPAGPQGLKGDQGDPSTVPGPQGDQGVQGIQGIQGIQGETGPQGLKGDKGDKGDQGIQGIQGETGEPGTTTWAGITDKPSVFAPDAHKTSHQDGGTDELDLTGLVGSVSAASVQSALAQAWTTPAYAAADFSGSGSMIVTVDAGDVISYNYLVVGKTMFLNLALVTFSISGTPSTFVQIKIPADKTPLRSTFFPCYLNDAGVWVPGFFYLAAGGHLSYVNAISGAAWTAGTNNKYIYAQAVFEIN